MAAPPPAGSAALPDRRASIDELDRAIVNLAGRINAATHDFLVLVRRFDERAGWLGSHCDSCAQWLAWRCDMSQSAAREKVRVAHALKTLPAIGRTFAEGRLSYSKVRALTRVAGPANEDELLAFALTTTAAHVEERCRELRCGTAASLSEAVRAHMRRGLSLRRDPERGVVTLTVELPYETGELVDKALDRALEAEVAGVSEPEIAEESWAAQRADALVAMAKAYLSGGDGSRASATPDHYQVTVHVDEAALRGSAGRSALPIETVRRLACDSDVVVITEDAAGNPLNIGRKTRVVPAAIRRAIYARDRHCRFPGCRNTRFLHVHHIRHWKDGGETSVENGLLLCPRHHWLPHEGGYTIEKDWRGRWFFRRPDGRAVPACGYCPEDVTDDGAETAGAYFECGTVVAEPHASAEAPDTSAEATSTSAEAVHASAEASRTSAEAPRTSSEALRSSGSSPLCGISDVGDRPADGWSVKEPRPAPYCIVDPLAETHFRGGVPLHAEARVFHRSADGYPLGQCSTGRIGTRRHCPAEPAPAQVTRNTFMTSSPR
ncbi:MAG TPA: DUF222 domain-containing protein [Woeseiaceae bacterium]